jgi:hypothetical protein
MLLEEDRSSIGLWENGILISGIVIVFKQIPDFMDVRWEEREIHYVYPVRNREQEQ